MTTTSDALFTPITTEAGHVARMAAVAGGFAVDITHIALGATGYTVPINATTGRSTATALRSEKDRAEIQDVRNVSDFQKDISFIVEPSEEYYIREIGFLMADGTLYAVASHPTLALDWASPQTRNLFALEYIIEDGDAASFNIVSNGPPLNLLMSREFAVLSTLQFTNALENLRQADRIHDITGAY
ncbi:MAG: hypothetical protein COB39_03250 [Marinosulfonomonas sp.]|nr:MAG: hypothetical protein COB39_03250 [Marinosulfonomonas sp.]